MTATADRSRKVLLLGGVGLLLTLTALGTAAWALVRAESERGRRRAADVARAYARDLLSGLARQEGALHDGPWVVLDASQRLLQPTPPRPFAPPPPVSDRAASWVLDRVGEGDDLDREAALDLAMSSSDPVVRLRAAAMAVRSGGDAAEWFERAALSDALLATREGTWLALAAGASGAPDRALVRIGGPDEDAAAALLLGTAGEAWDPVGAIHDRRGDLARADSMRMVFASAPAVDADLADRVVVESRGAAFVALTARPASAPEVPGAAWWLGRLPEGSVENVATRQKRPHVEVAGPRAVADGETIALPGPGGFRVVATEPPEAASGLIVAGFGVASAAALLAFAAFARAVLRESRVARLRSEFVATVGHELRTPVAVIRSAAEALALGRARTEDDRARLVAGIVRESERLSGLLGNVLDFARMEAGRRRFAFAPHDVPEIVRQAVAAHAGAPERAGVEVLVDVPPDLPPLRADRDALTAALVNLLDNAVKFGQGAPVEVTTSREGDVVAISVRDHGPGVPDAEKPRVFERFFRGAGDAVRETRGTGIGLALVRHAAEAHGGSVAVEDTPGGGATFRILVPLREVEEG